MAETRIRHAGEERLTPDEVVALQARLAADRKGAVSVRDLAEASGLDEEAVRQQLKSVRAEGDQMPRVAIAPRPARPAWPFVAVGALALAVVAGVFFSRGSSETQASSVITQTAPTSVTRTESEGNVLTGYSHGSDVGALPPGFEVAVSYKGLEHMSQERGMADYPQPYARQRDQLVQVIENLANLAYQDATLPASTVKPPYRNRLGQVFDLEPGSVHLGVRGWSMSASEKIRVPFGRAERAQVRKVVEKVLADDKRAQEAALGPSAEAIVFPPPSYRLVFAGRRLDDRTGPRLVFAPVDLAAVQRRLEAALQNAIARDIGPGMEGISAKKPGAVEVPMPDRYRGSIEGPAGDIRFDIPSAPGAERDRAIRELAAEAARQMTAVNARATKEIVLDEMNRVPRLPRVDRTFTR